MDLSSSKLKSLYFGRLPFDIEHADIELCVSMALVREEIKFNVDERDNLDFGLVYLNGDNIGNNVYSTQKAVQNRCKEFAVKSGFQLKLDSCRTEMNGTKGNAKYVCKT